MLSRRHLSTAMVAGLALPWSAAHARQTPETSTRWPTVTLEEAGFDPGLGATIEMALPDFPAVTGVVVARGGAIAFETYRGGYPADRVVNIRSVTKSVTSTLVGIALQRGELASIEVTVGEVLEVPADADPAVADLTMRDFLTMTSGLWWDGHDDWPMLLAAENWVENTLRQPIVALPGQQFVYNTGGSHLIGVMLARVLGRPLEDFANEVLFAPLGIAQGPWMRSPQGEVNGGSGLELLPRDLAKLGWLMRHGGAWAGAQLVEPGYAGAATTRQSDGESGTGGAIGVAYGYQWWVTDATGYEAFFALGFGGQYVYVVPQLDLVVVVAAGFGENEQPVLTSHRPIPERLVIQAILSP